MVYVYKLCYVERIVSYSTVDPSEIKTEVEYQNWKHSTYDS